MSTLPLRTLVDESPAPTLVMGGPRGGAGTRATSLTFRNYVETILNEDGLLGVLSLHAVLRDPGTRNFARKCPNPGRESEIQKPIVDPDQET